MFFSVCNSAVFIFFMTLTAEGTFLAASVIIWPSGLHKWKAYRPKNEHEEKEVDGLKSVPLDSWQATDLISRVNKVGLRVKPRTKPHLVLFNTCKRWGSLSTSLGIYLVRVLVNCQRLWFNSKKKKIHCQSALNEIHTVYNASEHTLKTMYQFRQTSCRWIIHKNC